MALARVYVTTKLNGLPIAEGCTVVAVNNDCHLILNQVPTRGVTLKFHLPAGVVVNRTVATRSADWELWCASIRLEDSDLVTRLRGYRSAG